MRLLALLFGISLTTISLLPNQPSLAQAPPIPKPSDDPLQLSFLTNPTGSVVTASTINEGRLIVPSLWWLKDNSQTKLLDNWIAYPATNTEPGRVDIIINQQTWSLLDYVERYAFINRIGYFARENGYNLRVFNYQKQRLANYTCNFSTNPSVCNINLNVQNTIGSHNPL